MSEKPKKGFRIFMAIAGGLALVLLILYMTGTFDAGKIQPGKITRASGKVFLPKRTARATIETITEFYEAVGTVRPRTEINVEAQITGRILNILVRPGDKVVKGKPLVVLDSREFQARLDQAKQGLISAASRREQARQAVTGAQAAYIQAESAFKRTTTYFKSEAATSQDLELAESGYRQAKARVQQARDALKETGAGVHQAEKVVEESKIALGYSRIRARETGEVAKRLAEPGDMAWPGKPLLVLQTRESLRLEAPVREGLIHLITPGTDLRVVVGSLGKTLDGTVEEVVPSADPMTRTFLVKVGLPREKGLYPGMFGRLMVPVEQLKVVVVPKTAVENIGQLEMVTVRTGKKWERVFIKTGRDMGDKVEILSGLDGGETLALTGDTDA